MKAIYSLIQTLDDNEMCLHITSINEKKPWTRNKMRITRKYDPVEKDLTAINTSSPPSSTSATPEELIEQRWGTTLEIFLPSEMKPDKNKTVSKSLESHRHHRSSQLLHPGSASSGSREPGRGGRTPDGCGPAG
jgi:hypothetical protein